MKDLLKEQLTGYLARSKTLEEMAIKAMKEGTEWEPIAKEWYVLKPMIETTLKELTNYEKMKNEELFIGAVVAHKGQIKQVAMVAASDNMADSAIRFRNDRELYPIMEIEPVQITPEILLRLEGENGERFSLNRHRFFIKNNSVRLVMDNVVRYWHSHYVQNMPIAHTHELQTRVRLDSGIVLNLKPE
jgi:hypothetical protein